MRQIKKLVSICILSLMIIAGTATTTFASDKQWILDILYYDYGVAYSDCTWYDGANGGSLVINHTDTDSLTGADRGTDEINMSEFYCTYENDSCMTTKELVRRTLIRHGLIEK